MKTADKIERIATSALVPYARNARTHSPEQVEQLKRSILEFGFTNPVLIDAQGGIVAGHGRVMAAKSIGLESVPCLRVDWLTEAQRRAYVLADNQLALNAGWDEEMLADELKALRIDGYDLDLAGFDNDRLADLIGGPLPGAQQAGQGGAAAGAAGSYQSQYGVIVICDGEAQQEDVFNRLQGEGYTCRVVVT